jgi:DNA polymerase-3 subunit delta
VNKGATAPFSLITMKITPAQLGKHLQGPLAPVYVISGDDPLLCQEAADAVRAAARQQGFDERQVFSADNNFDWGTLLQAGASLSLFAQRRLLELRLPSGKPGDKGAAALIEYCARPAEDTLLLISLPKLDGSAQKTKWGKALVDRQHTQFVQIWPVDAHQLPQWIRQRLSQAGLAAQQDAIELIAARVEGNLLAAAQEIEKLKLLAEDNQVTLETVQSAVADSARFDVFGLVDAILNGEAAHAVRMLEGLRGEGVEPPVILWALARELRLLASLSQQYSQGVPLDKAFSQARPPVWDKRKPLMSKALQRHSAQRWSQLLQDAQRVDAQIKGQAPGSVWISLSRLSLLMAGQRLALPAE